ncbi:Tetratricopeptide repeat protein 25 [Dufourea novaeangliae]|uniref:Outer dynein arm-docking complex subunit 4 n=2 Tax=Dufourea novaeangliae TaxID=178035 RepID=A0A154NX76_DUFNO|nr:Tetratricopeptide repeat protein 25 [Dufourea novaeangliae]
MGTRDIKQSLKMKQKQDRNLQLPEDTEPTAMLALGLREMRIGDVMVAMNCINKALDLEPNDRNALIARSKCNLLLGESQKALQDAENALQHKMRNANMAEAIYCKAEALYYLGDYEMSLVYYYRGMRIRPEYGQFRLGVQKAKDAIKNMLHKESDNMYRT